MKLKEEHLKQINTRREIIKHRQNEVSMLNIEIQILHKEATANNTKILESYGLDAKKRYEISEDGEITEVKNEDTKLDTKDEGTNTPNKSEGGSK
jgi:hypothetical protein|tara:strand:- start:16717 stop:17001 length:285 start_codon:yes stop_codon:yes gene_type:complete